ncbi:MAG: hypothetical protein JRJ59_09845 [Deltaproteobacteria bacterium]|nr:hypothetical protein [Deltaproteobacteria bacterium]
MKIVPLFPRVQTRLIRSSQPGPAAEPEAPSQGGDVIDLSRRKSQPASSLNSKEALGLLEQTLNLIPQTGGQEAINGLHRVKGNRAVSLLIRD